MLGKRKRQEDPLEDGHPHGRTSNNDEDQSDGGQSSPPRPPIEVRNRFPKQPLVTPSPYSPLFENGTEGSNNPREDYYHSFRGGQRPKLLGRGEEEGEDEERERKTRTGGGKKRGRKKKNKKRRYNDDDDDDDDALSSSLSSSSSSSGRSKSNASTTVSQEQREKYPFFQPGQILYKNYRFEKILGKGVFAKVVSATDLRTGRFVAIKIFRGIKRYDEAAEDEYKILKHLGDKDVQHEFHFLHCLEFLRRNVVDEHRDGGGHTKQKDEGRKQKRNKKKEDSVSSDSARRHHQRRHSHHHPHHHRYHQDDEEEQQQSLPRGPWPTATTITHTEQQQRIMTRTKKDEKRKWRRVEKEGRRHRGSTTSSSDGQQDPYGSSRTIVNPSSMPLRPLDLLSDFHCGLVFPLCGPSVYDLLKQNKHTGFPIHVVRSVGYQLLKACAFIHGKGVVHTDIKPENVLFQTRDLLTSKENFVDPVHTSIYLLDFGNGVNLAPHADDEGGLGGRFVSKTKTIQTRHYRAPEVVLHAPWNFPADIWSVGCMLPELLSGECLFMTHEDKEHLHLMEKLLGPMSDSTLDYYAQYSKDFSIFYSVTEGEKVGRRYALRHLESKSSRNYVRDCPRLEQLCRRAKFLDFYDLVSKLLAYNPEKRLTASAALQHPFFTTSLP